MGKILLTMLTDLMPDLEMLPHVLKKELFMTQKTSLFSA
jgi:hypothetical protein